MTTHKKIKDCLTIGLCAKMDGSMKSAPIVINKALTHDPPPRERLDQAKNLGIYWFSNPTAWMIGIVFHAWLLKFDCLMVSLDKTKVTLLMDSAPTKAFDDKSFGEVEGHESPQFLPANTMACFQPMDAGVIASFKCHYWHLLICKQLKDFDLNKPYNLDVQDAMQMIIQTWDNMTKTTTTNCWRHCSPTIFCEERVKRFSGAEINLESQPEADGKDASNDEIQEAMLDNVPDTNLNATQQDPDLDNQITELLSYLKELSVQSMLIWMQTSGSTRILS